MSTVDRVLIAGIAIGVYALLALQIATRESVYDRAIENRLTNTALKHLADIAAGTCANTNICKGP